jgi:hypothetical protein
MAAEAVEERTATVRRAARTLGMLFLLCLRYEALLDFDFDRWEIPGDTEN